MVIGVVAAALVIAGVVPFSTVLYAGMFGGMLLMHLGGHGGHGRADKPGDQKTLAEDGREVDDDGQPGSCGCH